MQSDVIDILTVSNDGQGSSKFGSRKINLNGTTERMLSEQQSCLNFRLRASENNYISDWHVAGDPTLIVVLSGAIEIELRDGQRKILGRGDMFVAEDFLHENINFDQRHGHRARIAGEKALKALHLKLAKR